MALSRRAFLGLAAGGAATGTAAWAGLFRDRADDADRAGGTGGLSGSTTSPESGPTEVHPDRILVVVQLSGGNDGLNSFVPALGAYRDARPTLAIPEAELIALKGEARYSLHPALAPLAAQWDAGRLAALESIGFEGASRSHFEATDSWTAGAPGLPPKTGWLGRWLDETSDSDPDPLRAIAIGPGAGPVLRAEKAPVTAIVDPDRFLLNAPRGVDAESLVEAFLASAAPLGTDPLMAAAQQAIPSSVSAVRRLASVAVGSDPGQEEVQPGDEVSYEGELTTRLELAAQLLTEDLGARVIVVSAEGFDTHAAQADEHERLLGDLATGLDRFLSTIEQAGLADRTLVVTTSEFGRRIRENGSAGTDHGSGGLQFVIGSSLKRSQIVGEADVARPDPQGDLRPTIDARSLYTVALEWLGGPTTDVVGGTYDHFDLLKA